MKYRDKWIQIIGIPLITIFEYYLTYSVYKTGWMLAYELCSDAIKIFIIWQLIKKTVIFLDRNLPYEKNFLKRLCTQIAATTVLGIAALTAMVHLEYYFLRPYPNQHFFSWDIIIAFLFILQGNLIYIGLYFYQSYQEKQKQTEKETTSFSLPAPVPSQPSHILVKVGNRNIKVDFEEILILFSENKDSFLLNKEQKLFLVDQSLDRLEEMLGLQFFRANRQFIVTRKIVSEIRPDANGKLSVKLHSPSRLPETITISRTKAPAFRKWMEC